VFNTPGGVVALDASMLTVTSEPIPSDSPL